jgi:hypothetical protein
MIFVNILYLALHKDIDQNLTKFVRVFSLGIRGKNEEFMPPLAFSFFLVLFNIQHRSCMMMPQQA